MITEANQYNGNFFTKIITRTGNFFTQFTNLVSPVLDKAKKVCGKLTEKTNQIIRSVDFLVERAFRTLFHLTNVFLELSRLLPFILVICVHYAFEKGDRESIEFFISDFLNMKPVHDEQSKSNQLEALWILIKRAPNWLNKHQPDLLDMRYYLIRSIMQETKKKRYKKDEDQLHKIIKENANAFIKVDSYFSNNPLNYLIEKEDVYKIQNFLVSNISEKKFELESKMVALILHGYSFKDCVKELNCTHNDITTFKRRLERKMKKIC